MVRSEMITLRVEPQVKKQLEKAAKLRGHSLTTFVLEAAEGAATEALESQEARRGMSPQEAYEFVKKACEDVKRGGRGYGDVGSHFVFALRSMRDYANTLSPDEGNELNRRISTLNNAASEMDDVALLKESEDEFLKALHGEFPEFFDLIPKQRHKQFAEGTVEHLLSEAALDDMYCDECGELLEEDESVTCNNCRYNLSPEKLLESWINERNELDHDLGVLQRMPNRDQSNQEIIQLFQEKLRKYDDRIKALRRHLEDAESN